MNFVRPNNNWGFFQLLRYIDVVNLKLLDTITINAREFMYTMSTAMMTCRCSFLIETGTAA